MLDRLVRNGCLRCLWTFRLQRIIFHMRLDWFSGAHLLELLAYNHTERSGCLYESYAQVFSIFPRANGVRHIVRSDRNIFLNF